MTVSFFQFQIMPYPKTCKAWRRSNPSSYPLHLVQHADEKLPEKLESDDVVIKVKAVSLNFRDIAMLEKGRYPGGQIDEGIVASDCGAEVGSFDCCVSDML